MSPPAAQTDENVILELGRMGARLDRVEADSSKAMPREVATTRFDAMEKTVTDAVRDLKASDKSVRQEIAQLKADTTEELKEVKTWLFRFAWGAAFQLLVVSGFLLWQLFGPLVSRL